MIQAPQLLADLVRQLKRLEDDLRQRVFDAGADVPALKPALQAEWQAARDADRTAETFETWAEQVLTQAGVHWLLSCVFIRFIEDNALVERPWLSGTPESGRLALARDRHEAYFRAHPTESDRDYLLAAFRDAGTLPGLATFFDDAHNPVFRLPISGDAAMALRQFWQQVDPNTGTLVHDFGDPAWNTRFLGDLYQDLSEATRKRYALLQTPEFVEAFILDRTLTPAIREFGFRDVRMIDPTCGSGHFLLGGFHRLVDEWARAEPGRNRRDIAQKALDAVAGVDLNPFAVAIARFRLLLAALKVGEVQRLADAPNFKPNVAIGDSLLHGARFGLTATVGMFEGAEHYAGTGLAHAYASEDLEQVGRILGRQYHAVVGNPPYIVVRDAALNAAYRQRYASCHMKYSLGAPFTERFFELAVTGNGRPAGYVGLITANSFMKREFGSKLIEQVLPRLDLTHVVDTSGAYIPGHGTPTVILFGRHRAPVGDAVRTVMGIKGEPSTPDDPAQGLVWSAIVGQIDRGGSESEFVSVGDTPRATFAKHPWSIGGGGAADLKEVIESDRPTVRSIADEVGITAVNGEDDLYLLADAAHARRIGLEHTRPMVTGDLVRDWNAGSMTAAWMYDGDFNLLPLEGLPRTARYFWLAYSVVSRRKRFGTPMVERGLTWYEYQELYVNKLQSPLTITFGEVATHNHFVLDRGGKVFNRTAPVIKLPAGSSEDEHLGLLGLLNSSVACFWLKQVCFNKGNGGIGGGISDEKWELRYAHNASQVAEFPLSAQRPLALARTLDTLARDIESCLPAGRLRLATEGAQPLPTRQTLDEQCDRAARLRRQAVAWQEELDWACYALYGLLPAGADALRHDGEPPEVRLGERAFEIVLARRVAAGRETTTWFERHGSTPVTEMPAHWPEDYRQVVQRRIALIDPGPGQGRAEPNRNIALIERPEYKRRWNTPAWDDLERTALRDWLLDRLEAPQLWPAGDDHPPQLTTVNRLADAVRFEAGFMQIAALYAGHSGFDVAQVVAELVAGESVPFLPVLRYTETGLRKRAQWENTWALQRQEDAGEQVGKIPVPPKYQGKDFLKTDFWRLRGGLDVPKERWVSYPGCERGTDASLVIAWAGWNPLQQATALAAYYLDMKDNEGWPREGLQPLLAGLLELVPWLKQWHNEVDPAFGERMGDFYEGFVNDQARELGFTRDDLRAWRPAPVAAKRRGRKSS
ncbi:MAG: BREX-2 system adenine-specific DNA-methyltransferase PglX [Burkholderiales bacterium]|nr:BREX-2 system adenine-specific DNA-methyltransferase PglX [Burkholderiales bacterium]